MMAEEAEEGMEPSLVRQEYLCDFSASNAGAIYGDLMEALERRDGLAEFDHPTDGVFTAWDLGFTDATGIWFWRIRGGAAEVIDHYESHGKPLSHYCDIVDAKPYRYVKHWLPHDARAKTLATGTSILEQVTGRWGAGAVAIGPSLSLLDGIQAGRWLLQQPEFRIHPRCTEGIEALRAYHYEYDEDRKTFSRQPEHDWSSHTADAFRYLALVVRHTELVTRKSAPPPPKPAISLGALFEDRERNL
jgi:phage terminase large subunit